MPTHTRAPASAHDTTPLLLDYPRAAALLGLTPGALRDLVYRGRGPVPTRIGRRTLFAVSDLNDFVAAHRSPPPPQTDEPHPRRRRGRPTIAEVMASEGEANK